MIEDGDKTDRTNRESRVELEREAEAILGKGGPVTLCNC